jgi:hypothetical protein
MLLVTDAAGNVSWENYLTDIMWADYETGNANPTYLKGRVFYDDMDNTLAYYNENSDVVVNIGQEVIIPVRNNSGATIANGSVVRGTGAVGSRLTVVLAQADTLANADIACVTTVEILNNSSGYCTLSGVVRDFDTSAFSEGDLVYLSDTVAGGLTNVEPPISVVVGRVILSSVSQGKLAVNISKQFERSGYRPNDDTAIADGTSISLNGLPMESIQVAGSGGPITLSATPFGAGPFIDRATVTLMGTSDTNTVTLNFNDAANGALINGNITLEKDTSITLQWFEVDSRWKELNRN